MQPKSFNILSRRAFLSQSFKTSMAVALATLTDIPFVMKRALAEGNIGLNGKKIIFIWLRGANDGLNSVIPVQDSTYYSIRQPAPGIAIQKDVGINYANTRSCFDATQYADASGAPRSPTDNTYSYDRAITLGNDCHKHLAGIGWKGGALCFPIYVSVQPPPNRTGIFQCIRLSNTVLPKFWHSDDGPCGNRDRVTSFAALFLIGLHFPLLS